MKYIFSTFRFSTTTQEFVFDADLTLQGFGDKENCIVPNENLFRVPSTSKISESTGCAASPRNVPFSELTISPGNKATNDKFNIKLRKLHEMQKKRELNKASKSLKSHNYKVDFTGTEKSFVEWNSNETGNMLGMQLAYVTPEPKFSDISCIRPSDTSYALKRPTIKNTATIVCSTPLRQSSTMSITATTSMSASDISTPVQTFQPPTMISSTIKEMVLASDEEYLMSRDDRRQRQMEAMSVWCNMILRSQYEHEEFDIGSTKQEANKVLRELLLKSRSGKSPCAMNKKPFKYADFLRKQRRDSIRESATRLLNSSDVPHHIQTAVKNRVFFIRADCNVHSDLTLQTTLLRLFLSFHPAWLHLGLETVFQTEIKVSENEVFAQVISRFILQHLFSDPKIMKNKKYAYGGGKQIVTDAGREALHSHFLLYTSLFCYIVETAKSALIINHNPRMFTRSSPFKSMEDVFSELSREVLSGSGASLNKTFAKIGFKPTFKQSFLDDYVYSVKTFGDLTDGVVLGKIIELVAGCTPGSLMNRLRNPCGDRLRKIGNIKVCLQVASEQGLDVQAGCTPGSLMNRLRNPCGDRLRKIGNIKVCLQVASEQGLDVQDIKPESLVLGNSDAILEILWKLVGIYVVCYG
ncbi:hypothetical protein DICVIV_08161 [Dictyocaulus viviparus]|uniref:Uncharacterized protein n=1 Tax=Dictyocaulus viviparus TaxID=29172 RepID=A0A0D8XMM2_DICVI|nr:hypothetical protein DICVIV_08161 [Dictyocaulus viviparus]